MQVFSFGWLLTAALAFCSSAPAAERLDAALAMAYAGSCFMPVTDLSNLVTVL